MSRVFRSAISMENTSVGPPLLIGVGQSLELGQRPADGVRLDTVGDAGVSGGAEAGAGDRSEEHTSELQSH